MNVLDLFSGIGGFSLGLERAGMRTIAFCECDPYCQKILGKYWPQTPICADIRAMEAYRRAEGPGHGYVRARSFAWQDSNKVRGQSAIDVGCSAPTNVTTRQTKGATPSRPDDNSSEAAQGTSEISFPCDEDNARANIGSVGEGSLLPEVRWDGHGYRSHAASRAGRADGIIEPSITLSPLSPPEVQAGQKGGLNGSHADVGPIDVICGGFP